MDAQLAPELAVRVAANGSGPRITPLTGRQEQRYPFFERLFRGTVSSELIFEAGPRDVSCLRRRCLGASPSGNQDDCVMESPGTSTTSEHQNALLQVVAGPSAGTLIRVGRELRIGRAEPGEAGLGSDLALSRHHATVRQSVDGVLTIEDAGSTNGTYVNDARIMEPRRLYPGDTLRLGATTLQVASPPRPVGDDHATMISRPIYAPWPGRRNCSMMAIRSVAWRCTGSLSQHTQT